MASWGLALTVVACAPSEREIVGWPKEDAELFFLLRPRAERPVEVVGLFGRGSPAPERIVELELEDDERLFALGVRRRASGAWSETSFPLPTAAADCGGTGSVCGQRLLDQPATVMVALSDGRLLVGPSRCSALLLVSPDERCVEPLLFSGEPLGRRSGSSFTVVARLGDRLAIAGNGGELLLLGP